MTPIPPPIPAWSSGSPPRPPRPSLPISAAYPAAGSPRESAPLPHPWPEQARQALVAVLGAGRPAIAVFEALDQAGLLVRLLPEWAAVRCRPQHNPVHRFTVDRHLVETAAEAAALSRQVGRPDLLLLGGLLHDIGKGYPGDHTEAGRRDRARDRGAGSAWRRRMRTRVTALVRHHLLLPETATNRDLRDPATVEAVGRPSVTGRPSSCCTR